MCTARHTYQHVCMPHILTWSVVTTNTIDRAPTAVDCPTPPGCTHSTPLRLAVLWQRLPQTSSQWQSQAIMPPKKRKAAPKLLAIVEDGDDTEMLGPSTSQPAGETNGAASVEAEIATVIARATEEGGGVAC